METNSSTSPGAGGPVDTAMDLGSELHRNGAPRQSLVDPAKPFFGVVICCTNIPPEQRTELERIIGELGGVHKYDLTPDVTHLIVGDYDTAKYRHVAKERMDVLPMAAEWVSAVKKLWMEDLPIDFDALEREWRLKTFERRGRCEGPESADAIPQQLLCCLTGFNDVDERKRIVAMVEDNGGVYTGDLTRLVTHLIVAKPEGQKYNHARRWDVKTVSVEWLDDSIARGMILDENLYDPTLPASERGKNAWKDKGAPRISHTKRLRDAAAAAEGQGRRKLRKTASMKMMSQTGELWVDILRNEQSASVEPSVGSEITTQPPHSSSLLHNGVRVQRSGLQSLTLPDDTLVFASCCFVLHGFSQTRTDVLAKAVSGLGGHICSTLDELTSMSGDDATHRFLIVPQTSKAETHPQVPEEIQVVTEFYVEKCLYRRRFFPAGEHALGKPFPSFPIAGFQRLAISTAGFTDIDLNHVDKAVRQLGARYEEKFTTHISVLVCSSLSAVRKQKLDLAVAWNVPVVKADWLWECISTGLNVPYAAYMFPELGQVLPEPTDERLGVRKATTASSLDITAQPSRPLPGSSRSIRLAKVQAKSRISRIDMTAFSKDEVKKKDLKRKASPSPEHDCDLTTLTEDFETAPTHQKPVVEEPSTAQEPAIGEPSAPLSVKSPSELNRVRRLSQKSDKAEKPTRQPLARVRSEVADSEEESDVPSEHEHEDEEQPPAGIPGHEDEEQAPTDMPEEERQAEETHAPVIDEAEARRQRHEKERNALATNLISMIDASSADATAASTETCEPAAEQRRQQPPRRRTRRPLGRAVSNASAGSNGGESRALIRSHSGGSATTASVVDESQAPPPNTQICFEDPEADMAKAALHQRITGGQAGKAAAPRRETKLTLGDVGGYAMKGGEGRATTGGLGARRVRRR